MVPVIVVIPLLITIVYVNIKSIMQLYHDFFHATHTIPKGIDIYILEIKPWERDACICMVDIIVIHDPGPLLLTRFNLSINMDK